ncbi:MAG: NusA-like transcription termination signal-binding factor [Candidatus Woesearchaeota archaeon]
MTRIKIDAEQMQTIALFEKITRARVKDMYEFRERLLFVVEYGDIRKALGKDKFNVEKIEHLLNRKIKIVEFNPELLMFIRNLVAPLKIVNIVEENGIVTITGPDAKTKGLMIGARAQNLRMYETIVKKYYPIEEMRVI